MKIKTLHSKRRRFGDKYLFFRYKNFSIALTLRISLWPKDSRDIVSSSIQNMQVTREYSFIRMLFMW